MADDTDEPTATDELAAKMRSGAVISPLDSADPAGADPATGLPTGSHDDSSPLDEGAVFDPTRGNG